MGRLDGKVCLVTGASRGIGAAIAKVFAEEGGLVACVARTLHEGEHRYGGSLDGTVAAIRAAGGKAEAFQANIAEHDECVSVVGEVRQRLGPVDVLINNAALSYFLPVRDYPYGRLERTFAVSVFAPILLSQLVLPDMVSRRSGAIVNISSSSAIGPGRGPYPAQPSGQFMAIYGSTKAALERLTQGFASEVYGDGVSVAALAPSQVVPSGSVAALGVIQDETSPNAEPPEWMARAALLLATAPIDQVSGRVCYSQPVLKEFGWLEATKGGTGIDHPGSGYSQI